jgi:hypothetical protein
MRIRGASNSRVSPRSHRAASSSLIARKRERSGLALGARAAAVLVEEPRYAPSSALFHGSHPARVGLRISAKIDRNQRPNTAHERSGRRRAGARDARSAPYPSGSPPKCAFTRRDADALTQHAFLTRSRARANSSLAGTARRLRSGHASRNGLAGVDEVSCDVDARATSRLCPSNATCGQNAELHLAGRALAEQAR